MATPKKIGNEVVLRGDPFSCIVGCQRASFDLLVKKATSHLHALRVSLRRLIHSATFFIASYMVASASSLLE